MGDLVDFSEALSQKQRDAMLLMAQGLSCPEISEQLGVAAGTLYNWKSQNAEFRLALRRLQSQLFAEGVNNLRGLVGQATATLANILADAAARDTDKLAAARLVLQYAGVDGGEQGQVREPEPDETFAQAAAEIAAFLRKGTGGQE